MDDVSIESDTEVVPARIESVIRGPTVSKISARKKPTATRLRIRMVPRCVIDSYKCPRVGEKRKNVIQPNPATSVDEPDIICIDDESSTTNGLKFKKSIAEIDSGVMEAPEHNVGKVMSERGSKRHADEKNNWYAPKRGTLSNTDYDSDVVIIEDELPDSNERIPYDDYDFVNDPYLPKTKVQANQDTKRKHKTILKEKHAIQPSISVMIPSQKVNFRGTCLTRGDIVSVVDTENQVYYAQIRGFLQDQFSDKSALVTWLLPTQGSPKDEFDPETFIIGPKGEIPRKLECFEFICHAPNEHFKIGSYAEFLEKPVCGYLMTKQGPKLVPLSPTHSSDSD